MSGKQKAMLIGGVGAVCACVVVVLGVQVPKIIQAIQGRAEAEE